MADDLAGAHTTGVHRNDLVVEPRETALVLGNQLRVKPRGDDRLLPITVSPVARLLTGQVMVHLGVENPFGRRLLQFIDQPPLGSKTVLGSAPASN
jgi:hypothetical protein